MKKILLVALGAFVVGVGTVGGGIYLYNAGSQAQTEKLAQEDRKQAKKASSEKVSEVKADKASEVEPVAVSEQAAESSTTPAAEEKAERMTVDEMVYQKIQVEKVNATTPETYLAAGYTPEEIANSKMFGGSYTAEKIRKMNELNAWADDPQGLKDYD